MKKGDIIIGLRSANDHYALTRQDTKWIVVDEFGDAISIADDSTENRKRALTNSLYREYTVDKCHFKVIGSIFEDGLNENALLLLNKNDF